MLGIDTRLSGPCFPGLLISYIQKSRNPRPALPEEPRKPEKPVLNEFQLHDTQLKTAKKIAEYVAMLVATTPNL